MDVMDVRRDTEYGRPLTGLARFSRLLASVK
jgi:hypothetical protein